MVRELTASVTREHDAYVAQCLEVDVASQGDTFEHALEMLKEALELYFDNARDVEVRPAPIIARVSVAVPG